MSVATGDVSSSFVIRLIVGAVVLGIGVFLVSQIFAGIFAPQGPGSVEIVGLFDILEYEEGIEYSAEVSTPGSGSNTKTEIKRRPLPYEVLNKAFRKLTKFLYEIDVLTTPDSENDATAVDKI